MSSKIIVDTIEKKTGDDVTLVGNLDVPTSYKITGTDADSIQAPGLITSAGGGVNSSLNTELIGASNNRGWKLLQTETISSAVSYKDIGSTSLLSSTYETYKIICNDIGLAADNSIYVYFSINTDNNFITSGSHYDYTSRAYHSANGNGQASSASESFIKLNPLDVWGDNNETDPDRFGFNAEITIPDPSQTGRVKMIYGTNAFLNSSGYSVITTFVGGFGRDGGTNSGRQGPITGIRIKGASQNLTRGTIRLYGVVNA